VTKAKESYVLGHPKSASLFERAFGALLYLHHIRGAGTGALATLVLR